MSKRLVLASRSPRRAEILREAGYRFTIRAPRTDESILPRESPFAAAERLARQKADEIAARFPDARVLAADTIVVVDGEPLGKPLDASDARRMLKRLSARAHRVVTGVAVRRSRSGRVVSDRSLTSVTFKRLSRREIDWYVGTGDPFDKAGGYGIQSGAGLFVTSIRGSYTNVVGLPLELVYRMLGLP